MIVGHNTISGEILRSYVEKIERLRTEKKDLADAEKAVIADAKANGFTPSAIRDVIKIRAMKPHDRAEAEAILDVYLHALGMVSEPPLFRFAGLAAIDTPAREQVLERMREFVPAHGLGEITVTMGGKAVRLSRDKDGAVRESEVVEQPKAQPAARPNGGAPARPEVPDVDDAGAFALGRQFARDNRAVIENPFPFGDPRRARFDEGWRDGAGNDGMGG